MTVRELIQLLQKQDQGARVVTLGYEGGYGDIENITEITLKLNVHKEWYYGPHEKCEPGEQGVKVVWI